MSDPINDPNLISAMQALGRGLKSPSDLAQLSRELLNIPVEASLNAEMDAHLGMASMPLMAITPATVVMAITVKP